MAGGNPSSAAEVNSYVGSLLRQFQNLRDQVARSQLWMAANDLKTAPYSMTSGDEANIKSAISGLNTALGAVDTTFIKRLDGLW